MRAGLGKGAPGGRRLAGSGDAGLHTRPRPQRAARMRERKPSQPGRAKSESFEDDFTSLVSLPGVSNILSRVFPGRSLVEGRDIPEYWCRSDSARTLFFFANPLSKSLRYPMRLGQSHQRDIIHISAHANVYGRQVELRLVFNRYDSLLVSIDRSGGVEIDNLGYSPPDPVVEGHES